MNIQNLVLDINKKPFQTITANKGEVGSRFIRITIVDNSTPVDLTGVTISLYAKKPDGKKVFNSVTVEDKVNGVVLAELTSQILSVSGLVRLTLLLVKNGSKLASKQFLVNVDESIVDDEAIESTNEFTALVDALGRVNNIDSRFEKVNSQLEHKVSKGQVSVFDVNKNLGKFDQTYFTDEFLQQMSGNTPINATPSDYSITQKKMATPYLEAIKGKNLFDKSAVTNGKYVNMGTGNLSPNESYSASDFIKVEPNTTYTISGTGQQYAIYDSSKNYIRGIGSSRTFTTADNEVYVRISLFTTELNLVQVELGSIATSYEDYNTYYLNNDCITKIPKEKVDIETIDYIKSVNLFDKSAVTNGKYVNMGNGNLSTNANFSASDYIEVEPSTSYCFSNFNTGTQGAYYDSSKVFISGIGTKVTTSPSNAKYMRFGCPSVDIPTMQLQKGKNTTAYEPYGGKFISYESISSEAKSKLTRQPSNVKKVALDGSCDYTSISSAVDNANSEIVIQVMPGVYDNIVKGFGKDISIIGVDKKRCILKNTTGDYNTPPLEMTHGYLANMTIYAEKLEGATIPSMLAYAIHIDRSASRNQTLLIENCDFYSDWNACAGIGTWANFTLTFRNCNFYMNNPTQTNGALFFHNAGVEGELNQNIIFDNCRMYSKSDVGIYIGDALTNGNSPLNATFINTLVYSSTKGKDCIRRTSGSKWSGNNISLTGDSYGNNNTILNAN